MTEIRDPIHGAIPIADSELPVADHRWVQRLRHIHQTGFSQLAFPGATHSRYLHSLGVMHLAGLAFDRAYADWSFSNPEARVRFRAAVRLAALCHDLGHAPYSHCMEFCMPPVADLGLRWPRVHDARRATHEDYTIAILEQTDLGDALAHAFEGTAQHIASLIEPSVRPPDDFFADGGLDHRRLLSQIVSSELDVDRMDYLVRDALFTGAAYGRVDVTWLLSNLGAWVADGQVHLALNRNALYAFEHFLLARHHMFLMVYFHHKSVIYEEMLRRYVTSESNAWVTPSEIDAYLFVDDLALQMHLRACGHPMARRIVEQRAYRRVLERHGDARGADVAREADRLRDAGIDVIAVSSTNRLSRYEPIGGKRRRAPPIYVTDGASRAATLREASTVFDRYADEHVIARLYVAPEEADAAKRALA